jgi:hypothetical protein
MWPDIPSVNPFLEKSLNTAAMWIKMWRRCSSWEENVGIPRRYLVYMYIVEDKMLKRIDNSEISLQHVNSAS